MTYLLIIRDKERKMAVEIKEDPRNPIGDRQIVVYSYKDLVEILELLNINKYELLTIKLAGDLENGKDFKKELLEELRPENLNINLKPEKEEE